MCDGVACDGVGYEGVRMCLPTTHLVEGVAF